MQPLFTKLMYNPKKLFLTDGCGALLTGFCLFVILARFEDVFGMPQSVLVYLSAVAFVYAVYSFCCYFFVSRRWHRYLRVITIANLTYCVFTLGAVFYFYDSLTVLGIAYFLLECIVIVGLAIVELSAAQKRAGQPS